MTNPDNSLYIRQQIDNPWRNVYWFARMLINNDKYGGVGRSNQTLLGLTSQLRVVTANQDLSEQERLDTCKALIESVLINRYQKASASIDRVRLLIADLKGKLSTLEDVAVFILTVEQVIIPINNALENIPNDDRQYTLSTAESYLTTLGEAGLATVINFWDDAGVVGCLTAERVSVVQAFAQLREQLSTMHSDEADLILTAFVQEFERRLGQKRKGRAGGSLEDVTSFILEHYGIEATHAPEHFQADIEVDKWIRCSDKWLIGISCKRTLRERWKQVSSADKDTLSKFKIRQIWHLITYDEDLSDDKLALLGGLRHVFYLRDESRILRDAQQNLGLRDYVRPMSLFIQDLRKAQAST
jgi:hypothetical protein